MSQARSPHEPSSPSSVLSSSASETEALTPRLEEDWSRTPFWLSFADVFHEGNLQLTTDEQTMLLSAMSSPQERLSSIDLALSPSDRSLFMGNGGDEDEDSRDGATSNSRPSTSHQPIARQETTTSGLQSYAAIQLANSDISCLRSARHRNDQRHVNPQDIEIECLSADNNIHRRTSSGAPPQKGIDHANERGHVRPSFRKPSQSITPITSVSIAGHDCIMIPMQDDDSDDDYY